MDSTFLKHLRRAIQERKKDFLTAIDGKYHGYGHIYLEMPWQETETALDSHMKVLGYSWLECIRQFIKLASIYCL